MEPRYIGRKSILVVIRGERYEIYSLSITQLEKFKDCINKLVINFFKQMSAIPRLEWTISKKFFSFGKQIPAETTFFVSGLLNTIISKPLELLEAASGLPHELFDPTDKENCLALDEIVALVEIIFEVNGLDFMWEALRNRINHAKDQLITSNFSAASPGGTA